MRVLSQRTALWQLFGERKRRDKRLKTVTLGSSNGTFNSSFASNRDFRGVDLIKDFQLRIIMVILISLLKSLTRSKRGEREEGSSISSVLQVEYPDKRKHHEVWEHSESSTERQGQ